MRRLAWTSHPARSRTSLHVSAGAERRGMRMSPADREEGLMLFIREHLPETAFSLFALGTGGCLGRCSEADMAEGTLRRPPGLSDIPTGPVSRPLGPARAGPWCHSPPSLPGGSEGLASGCRLLTRPLLSALNPAFGRPAAPEMSEAQGARPGRAHRRTPTFPSDPHIPE